MTVDSRSANRGPLAAGALLVLAGIFLLVAQQAGLSLEWPIWIVASGVALIVLAVVAGQAGPGFAVVGGIVTMLGVVLWIQRSTDLYATWAYAWALVAPGGVGVGLFLYGLFSGRWAVMRSGLGPMVAGLVLFLIGYLFFEGVLGLSGQDGGPLGPLVAPALLVILGVIVIVAAFLPPRWRGGEVWPSGSTTGGTNPDAGAAAGWAAPGAAAAGEAETVAVDLGGAEVGDVAISFGAGKLAIAGPAAAGRLVDGVAHGGIRREDGGPGRVKLTTPSDSFWTKAWDRAPFDWRLGLSAEVPLRLSLGVGAAQTEADLSALQVTDLRIRSGAADTTVTLPAAAGATRVSAEGGAASLRIRVPEGVAARIRSSMALGSVDVDTRRFPRDPFGGWGSPDFASAANRVEIDIRGGVGSVRVG
jgi:hypothetical protein